MKNLVRMFCFIPLVSLLPSLLLVRASRFALWASRAVKEDVTTGHLPKSGPKKPGTRLNFFPAPSTPLQRTGMDLQLRGWLCDRAGQKGHHQ